MTFTPFLSLQSSQPSWRSSDAGAVGSSIRVHSSTVNTLLTLQAGLTLDTASSTRTSPANKKLDINYTLYINPFSALPPSWLYHPTPLHTNNNPSRLPVIPLVLLRSCRRRSSRIGTRALAHNSCPDRATAAGCLSLVRCARKVIPERPLTFVKVAATTTRRNLPVATTSTTG